MTNSTNFIEIEGITKTFPGLRANDNVNLTIKAGQVHALLGENGAGKSTLMKILYGVYQADSGTIKVDGKLVTIKSPADGRAAGIGMVFQSFMLIPAFTVIENVALSLKELGIVINNKDIEAQINKISEEYQFGIDPKAYVWQLPLGAQQKIEIIKLMIGGARLLIFDEPTSVLAPHEAEGLFKIFAGLKANGYSIIFISHKLNEVLACSDEITVLRQGRVVGTIPREGATQEDSLVSMIIGTKTANSADYVRRTLPPASQPLLDIKNVFAINDRGRPALEGLNMTLYPGEILGIAGVSGNGQKELGEVIQGVRPTQSGTILFDGQDITGLAVAKIKMRGIACIPEDPLLQGAVRTMTVEENLALGDTSSQDWQPMNWQVAREKASYIEEIFHLKMPRLNVQIQALSGGNVQRIVFAREMAAKAKLLLAYYPTRGTDINAAEIIRTILLKYRDEGSAILLVSEDLDELLTISDRVAVMFHGQNVGECKPENADIQEIGHLMTDGKYSVNAA